MDAPVLIGGGKCSLAFHRTKCSDNYYKARLFPRKDGLLHEDGRLDQYENSSCSWFQFFPAFFKSD